MNIIDESDYGQQIDEERLKSFEDQLEVIVS